jgi:hypothetical protein
LLLSENKGLKESLATKKKRNKHGKNLILQREGSYHRGAEWSSPRSFKIACERQAQREQAEEEEKLRKVNLKELKAFNTLLHKKLREEKRVERESKKEEGEGEGKEGSGIGPKETTERDGTTGCRGQENCATITKSPSNSLKETGSQ